MATLKTVEARLAQIAAKDMDVVITMFTPPATSQVYNPDTEKFQPLKNAFLASSTKPFAMPSTTGRQVFDDLKTSVKSGSLLQLNGTGGNMLDFHKG